MFYILILLAALGEQDVSHNMFGGEVKSTPTLAPKRENPLAWKKKETSKKPCCGDEKKKEEKKGSWPDVSLHVLGYKGCVPCEQMKPSFVLLKKEGYKIYYWDINKRSEWVKGFKQEYEIYPFMSMLITVDGKSIRWEEAYGVMGTCPLREWLQKATKEREKRVDKHSGGKDATFTFSKDNK